MVPRRESWLTGRLGPVWRVSLTSENSYLAVNQLTTLPEGIFAGLTALETL